MLVGWMWLVLVAWMWPVIDANVVCKWLLVVGCGWCWLDVAGAGWKWLMLVGWMDVVRAGDLGAPSWFERGQARVGMSCSDSSCRWWQTPFVYEPGHCEAPRLHSKCKKAKHTGMLSLTHTRELALAPIGCPVAGTLVFVTC